MSDFSRRRVQELHDLDGQVFSLASELFYDRTTAEQFVSIAHELKAQGFDLNGLQNRGWTVGRAGLMKGEAFVVYALDDVGYNFALDSNALDYSREAWHGSLHAVVAQSANKYDPTIEVPTFEREAECEAQEMIRPSFRGVSVTFVNRDHG